MQDEKRLKDVVRSMTQDAVVAANFTTSRKDPQTINVKIFEQTIKNGSVVDSPYCEFDIYPPIKRMTSEDFIIEHAIIVRDLSSEFLELVEEQMNRGKCYEEKIDIARSFTKSLSNALERYNKKILTSH
jgi:hypothetical protein